MDIGCWDQNPGTDTRPDIPLTAIPLTASGMESLILFQGCRVDLALPMCGLRSPGPRVGHHIGRPPTCPNCGLLLPRLSGPHAQPTPTPLRNLALRPCPFPGTSQTASGCFHSVPELTPSSIAACESQVNNEMIRSVIPGKVNKFIRQPPNPAGRGQRLEIHSRYSCRA